MEKYKIMKNNDRCIEHQCDKCKIRLILFKEDLDVSDSTFKCIVCNFSNKIQQEKIPDQWKKNHF